MLTYGWLIWWTKSTQKQRITKPAEVQKLACMCITRAGKNNTTSCYGPMETMLNLPPLHMYIRRGTRMESQKLECGGN